MIYTEKFFFMTMTFIEHVSLNGVHILKLVELQFQILNVQVTPHQVELMTICLNCIK